MITIVSGGQTGVDRAALDAAAELGLPSGGWCPRDRKAEDGTIPSHYPLRETPSANYEERTEWNVRDADATLIITKGSPSGGTAYTVAMAEKWARPCRIEDLADPAGEKALLVWLTGQDVQTLNVAGPRESTMPGIYADAHARLTLLLTEYIC